MQPPIDYPLPREKKARKPYMGKRQRQEIQDQKDREAHKHVFLDTDQDGDDVL